MEQNEEAPHNPLQGRERKLDLATIYEASGSPLPEIKFSKLQSQSKNRSEQQHHQLLSNSPVQRKELTELPLFFPSERPLANCVSPNVQRRGKGEAKERTPKKRKRCSCKNSRCLKLYCDCFASGILCDGCKCINCLNTQKDDGGGKETNEEIMNRNLRGSLHEKGESAEMSFHGRQPKGCNCKKSGCLKRYCECFQAMKFCSEYCNCVCCKNFPSSEERRILLHGNNENIAPGMQLLVDAAIRVSNEKPPTLKRKHRASKEMNFELLDRIPLSPLNTNVRVSDDPSLKASSISWATSEAELGSSKSASRSLLADIRRLDVEEFCSRLVVDSKNAAISLNAQKMDGNNVEDLKSQNMDSSTRKDANIKECIMENFSHAYAEQERVILTNIRDLLQNITNCATTKEEDATMLHD